MVNPALLASVDELDELIEYVASKRFATILVSEEQRAVVKARRADSDPANWLTDDEFDARVSALLNR